MWLPALGAALFLIVGLWWATRPATPEPVAADTAAVADAGAAAPAADAGTAAAPGASAAKPSNTAMNAALDAGRLSPEQAAQVQKMLQNLGH